MCVRQKLNRQNKNSNRQNAKPNLKKTNIRYIPRIQNEKNSFVVIKGFVSIEIKLGEVKSHQPKFQIDQLSLF